MVNALLQIKITDNNLRLCLLLFESNHMASEDL